MANSFDFTESFSHVSTLAQLLTKWRGTGNPGGALLPSVGGSVGGSFAIGTAAQGYQASNNRIIVLIPSGPSRKFGWRVSLGSNNKSIAWFYEPSNEQLNLSLDASNHIVLRRGGSTVLATSTLTITLSTAHYIAVELTIDNSAGIFNLWVDGVQYLNVTATDTQNTANAFIDTFSLGNNGGSDKFGDVIVYPSSMATIMDANVNPFKVNSAGSRTVFNRGGVDLGSNWQQISKALAATVNFNFSNVLNDRDNFVMDPASVGTLLGARLYAYAQKDGTGVRSMALTVESGATDDVGASQALGLNGYGFYGRDASVDPATAALWANFAALNAAKMGYKITV